MKAKQKATVVKSGTGKGKTTSNKGNAMPKTYKKGK